MESEHAIEETILNDSQGVRQEPQRPNLPEFPDEAYTGLFKKYLDLVGSSTEAPDAFHWAVFITIAGLLFGHSLFITQPKPLYANFFSLMIGETGLSRKSTAMRIGIEDILFKIDDKVEFSSGAVSSEAIYELLGKREGQRLLLNYDEARTLLQISKRQATSDILPRLNSLYNCPSLDSVDRRENSTKVKRPFVSLIAASPIEWLTNAIAQEDVMGGFLNRFVLVSGDSKPPIPFPQPPTGPAWEGFVKELSDTIEQYTKKPCEITWGDDARGLFKEFYFAWHERQRSLPGDTAALTNRIPDHVVKIAMLLSALSRQTHITGEATAIAIKVAGYLEQMALTVFGDIGLSRQGRVERMIINRLQNNGIMLPFRDLRLALGGKTDAESFNRAISGLEKAGVIKIIPQTDGRPKLVVLIGS